MLLISSSQFESNMSFLVNFFSGKEINDEIIANNNNRNEQVVSINQSDLAHKRAISNLEIISLVTMALIITAFIIFIAAKCFRALKKCAEKKCCVLWQPKVELFYKKCFTENLIWWKSELNCVLVIFHRLTSQQNIQPQKWWNSSTTLEINWIIWSILAI